MEIQRQSDYYSIDLPETRRVSFTADQIRDMTSGPSIPTGMLNTRTATWYQGDPWTYAPENIFPDDSGEGTDEEDDDPDAEEEPEGYELEDRLKKRDRYVSEDDIRTAADNNRPPYDRSPIEREKIQAIMDDYDLTPEEAVREYERREASLHEANPAALMRLLPLLEMGGGGDTSGVLDQALGDVSGAESKAAFDRAEKEY